MMLTVTELAMTQSTAVTASTRYLLLSRYKSAV